jgi:hypothetical protein
MNQWVAKLCNKLGRIIPTDPNEPRDREIGDYAKESNTTASRCHEPSGGFSSTTLVGDAEDSWSKLPSLKRLRRLICGSTFRRGKGFLVGC